MLRGCGVVALKVEDIAPNGYAVDRATVRQKKTGRPVKFELTDQTRQAVDDYLKAASKTLGEFLFTGQRANGQCMTTRQYARLLSEWVASIGLDPKITANGRQSFYGDIDPTPVVKDDDKSANGMVRPSRSHDCSCLVSRRADFWLAAAQISLAARPRF
jgi:hypothetical protein